MQIEAAESLAADDVRGVVGLAGSDEGIPRGRNFIFQCQPERRHSPGLLFQEVAKRHFKIAGSGCRITQLGSDRRIRNWLDQKSKTIGQTEFEAERDGNLISFARMLKL